MKDFTDHEELERWLGRRPPLPETDLPATVILYCTANWCGACKKLDLPAIEGAFPTIPFFKCDVDAQSHSAGFCNVRSIPAFCLFHKSKLYGPYVKSDTAAVIAWITKTLGELGVAKESLPSSE